MAHRCEKIGLCPIGSFCLIAGFCEIANRSDQFVRSLFQSFLCILEFGQVVVESRSVEFKLLFGFFAFRDVERQDVRDDGAVRFFAGFRNGLEQRQPMVG